MTLWTLGSSTLGEGGEEEEVGHTDLHQQELHHGSGLLLMSTTTWMRNLASEMGHQVQVQEVSGAAFMDLPGEDLQLDPLDLPEEEEATEVMDQQARQDQQEVRQVHREGDHHPISWREDHLQTSGEAQEEGPFEEGGQEEVPTSLGQEEEGRLLRTMMNMEETTTTMMKEVGLLTWTGFPLDHHWEGDTTVGHMIMMMDLLLTRGPLKADPLPITTTEDRLHSMDLDLRDLQDHLALLEITTTSTPPTTREEALFTMMGPGASLLLMTAEERNTPLSMREALTRRGGRLEIH